MTRALALVALGLDPPMFPLMFETLQTQEISSYSFLRISLQFESARRDNVTRFFVLGGEIHEPVYWYKKS
jgi:hypothetical protein